MFPLLAVVGAIFGVIGTFLPFGFAVAMSSGAPNATNADLYRALALLAVLTVAGGTVGALAGHAGDRALAALVKKYWRA